MTMLRGIAADLPDDAEMVTDSNHLPDLMGRFFLILSVTKALLKYFFLTTLF